MTTCAERYAAMNEATRKRSLMALALKRDGVTLKEIGLRVGGAFKDTVSRERARQLVLRGLRIEASEKKALDPSTR